MTIDAIYRDGALHPVAPLSLTEGAAVRVTVEPSQRSGKEASEPLAGAALLQRVLASASKARMEGDDPSVTSDNVDAVLYGRPGGVR